MSKQASKQASEQASKQAIEQASKRVSKNLFRVNIKKLEIKIYYNTSINNTNAINIVLQFLISVGIWLQILGAKCETLSIP